MATRSQLEAINDELRRLKAEGERGVTISDEAMEMLHQAVQIQHQSSREIESGPAPVAATVVEPAPPVTVKTAVSTPAPAASRTVAKVVDPSIPSEAPAVVLPSGDKGTRWAALMALVAADPVCRAHLRPEKKAVVGVGDLDAKIFFCGDAPAAEEEIQGEPFVGPAGQLLTKMIQGMGLKREQVYLGSIMNWRPDMPAGPSGVQVGNRQPTPAELHYCLPYFRAQVEIVQPDLIVALGASAAGGLLGTDTFKTLGEIKGRWHEFAGKPVMVTYDPSYILRNNSNRSKRSIWEDLLQVLDRAGLPVSEKQRSFFL